MAILTEERKEKIKLLFDIISKYFILGFLKVKLYVINFLKYIYNNILSTLLLVFSNLMVYSIVVYIKNHFVANAINAYEIRFYIILFLVLFLILLFAVLRLYNATVTNTSFIIKLRAEVRKLTTALNVSKESVGKIRGSIKNLHGVFQKFVNKQDEK